MGLNKGQTNNPNGRPKGSKNKTSQELRQHIIDVFFDIDAMQKDFEQLDAQQRMHFRKEFAGFVLPKMQSTSHSFELEAKLHSLDEMELDNIIEQLATSIGVPVVKSKLPDWLLNTPEDSTV